MPEPVDMLRLNELCDMLNTAMGDFTPYKLAVVDPKDIKPIDNNAHYMSKHVFDTLVANVKKDKNLSSLPFCWKTPEGHFVALSGNHRTKAAAEAGVPAVLVLFTDAALSLSQKRAIQLSHNALVGQDDPNRLREIWNEIVDLEFKVYTGLDAESLMAVKPVELIRINEASLRMEEVKILFMPAESDRLEEIVKRLGKSEHPRYATTYSDWDRFFEMLLKFKEASGIVSSATAIAAIMDIVDEWLADHQEPDRAETIKEAA